MKRLIVNADDFGLTEKVNQAIIEGHLKGIITSTSLLANGVAFESAVRLAQLHPKLGVGVHLNLTDGSPVSAPARIPSLVTDKGVFLTGPLSLARKVAARRVNLADVEGELRSQIERVLAAGIPASHLDGHKHFHVLPPVFDLVIQLAREYGIKGVRCTAERSVELFRLIRRNNDSSIEILKQYLTGCALCVLSSGFRRKLRLARLSCPTYFYGITQTGFLDAKALQKIIADLPQGASEIMCHPGYVDTELSSTPTRLLSQREAELQALIQPEIKQLIAECGIELISYRNLAESP